MNPIRSLGSASQVNPPAPNVSARLAEAANVPFDVLLGSLLEAVKQERGSHNSAEVSKTERTPAVEDPGEVTEDSEAEELSSDEVDEPEDAPEGNHQDETEGQPLQSSISNLAVATTGALQGETQVEAAVELSESALAEATSGRGVTDVASTETEAAVVREAARSGVDRNATVGAEQTSKPRLQSQLGAVVGGVAREGQQPVVRDAPAQVSGTPTEQLSLEGARPQVIGQQGELAGKAKQVDLSSAPEAPAPRPELFVRPEGSGYIAEPLTELPDAQLTPQPQRPEGVQGAAVAESPSGLQLPSQAAQDPTLSIQLQSAGQGSSRGSQNRQAPNPNPGGVAETVGKSNSAKAGNEVQASRPDALAQATNRSRVRQSGQVSGQASRSQAPRQAEVIDRMIKMARVTRSGDTSRAVVRMKPPELGEVRIELTVREGVVHTKLEVADPTVRALMDSHLAELRSSLADDGLEIGSFQVSVRDGGEGGQQRLAADRAASGYGAENGSERDEESLSEVTNSREDHDGQIDLMA